MRYAILQAIMKGMGYSRYMGEIKVDTYLDKYRFLVSGSVVPPELEGKVSRDILREIRGYRVAIKAYLQRNGHSPKNAEEIRRAENTPLDLRYHY